MNCDETRARIDEALDDGAELEEVTRAHLSECEACRRHAAEMDALSRRLSAGAQDVIEAAGAPNVDGVIAALASRPAVRRRGPWRGAVVAVACAAGLLLVLGIARNAREKGAARPKRTVVAKLDLTPERRDAVRVLEQAGAQLRAELARPVEARRTPQGYGRQYVDGILAGEMTGIESSVRSLEAFLIDCLPVPSIEIDKPSSGSRGRGIRGVRLPS